MIFGQNHHRKNKKTNSFLKPSRLVQFAFFKNPFRKELPDQMSSANDAILNRIKAAEAQQEKLESRQSIKSVLEGFDLEDKIPEMKITYEQLNAPIESSNDLKGATADLDSFVTLRKKLADGNLNERDLAELNEIGLSVFFTDDLSARINKATERALKRIKLDTLTGINTDYKAKAEESWNKNELTLGKKKERLISLKENLEAGLEGTKDIEAVKHYGQRLDEVEFELAEIEKQLALKNDWIKRKALFLEANDEVSNEVASDQHYFMGLDDNNELKGYGPDQLDSDILEKKIRDRVIEKEKARRPLIGKMLDFESKNEITNILLNAEFMRKKQIQNYLISKKEKVEEQFAILAAKDPSRFDENTGVEIQQKIQTYGKVLADERLLEANGQAYSDLEKRLDHVSSIILDLDKKLGFIDGYNEDPEKYKAVLQKKLANIRTHAEFYSPDKVSEEEIQKQLDALDEAERKRIAAIPEGQRHPQYDVFGGSKIYQQHKAKILAQRDGGSYAEIISDLESKIGNFEGLSVEEKAALIDDVDGLNKKLGAKYSFIREKIKDLNSADEIKAVLEKYLGNDHVEFVNSATFENYGDENLDLSKYTMEGGMVFYEKGDEWKIIIDESRVNDVEALKKQLNHELLHVEFENDEGIKNKFRDLFVGHEHWPEIRKNFLELFKNKKAPLGGEWKDDDILSELYAMQDDKIFNDPKDTNFAEGSPAKNLNELIWDINKDRLGIKEGEEIVQAAVRGYDGAEDASAVSERASSEDSEGSAGAGADIGSAKTNREELARANENIDSLLRSPYIGHLPGASDLLGVMKSFNKETEKINEEFASHPDSVVLGGAVKNRLEQVKEDIKSLNEKLADIGDKIPDQGGNIFIDVWSRTNWFAAQDFWKVGSDVMDWWKRRHERKKGDAAARIGTALADKIPLPYVSEFGYEAQARKEKAESEEVNEWKSRMESKDAWELIDSIKQMSRELMPNRDQLKATLRILADKGRIDWRMPELWTLLSKLQTSVTMSPNDDTLLKNPILLKQRLHQALGEIYDYDEFPELERNNESNYQSGKDKYAASLDKIQDQLTARLNQLLAKYEAGGQVDPQEYEGILEYNIKNGKSSAEVTMYHLMMGIVKGLLPADRGLSLDKYLNNWPATQWIYSKNPPLTQKDYEFYAKTYFPNSHNALQVKDDFIDFYWTMVQNDPMTIQRVRKSVSERQWDHDWGRAIACMGDANTAKRFLSGRSGQQEAKDTAVENSYAGAWMWLQRNAQYPSRINARKEFARQAAWIAMADGILDHVAYFNGSSDIYTRSNASMMDAIPREGALSGHSDWTTRKYKENVRNFLDQLDSGFFAIIRDEAGAKRSKEALGQQARDYLLNKYPGLASEVGPATNIDQIFDKMDAIIGHIVSNMSDEAFNRAINQVKIDDAGRD